jgi:hypothetical protein
MSIGYFKYLNEKGAESNAVARSDITWAGGFGSMTG